MYNNLILTLQELSTEVFEPLVNLQRLHMPPLSEDTVRELCDVVKSIDVVDITTHNVSCFYLASETSYEESIITQRPSTTETPKPKGEKFHKVPGRIAPTLDFPSFQSSPWRQAVPPPPSRRGSSSKRRTKSRKTSRLRRPLS